MDFDFEEFNIVSVVFGIISGLIGMIVAGSMMPGNILMKLIIFAVCAVAGYFVTNIIFEH